MATKLAIPKLTRKSARPGASVTGTSYKASPAIPPPPQVFAETGSSRSVTIREIVPELANRNLAVRTYDTMAKSDASVRVSLRAGKAPVLGGDFYIDAFDEQEQNQIISEFVDYNIFHAPRYPWLVVLQEILRFFEHGFSVFQPVYEQREWAPKKTSTGANRRVYTMLKKLAPRPAPTIANFDYDDNGGPVQAIQNAIDSKGNVKQVPIAIDRLIVFTFEGKPGNLEGESILRSAYKHYYYKDYLYKIDAIQKERHGIGVPDILLPPGYSEKDKLLAREMGRSLHANEESYILRSPGMEVKFAELSGNLVNVLESATHHDNMIMKNIMVQFLNLGIEGQGGGRATGATAADMFLKAMRYVANLICAYINMYLIPNLVAYNFQTDQLPQMKVRNIGEAKDLQMWATAIANLVDKNVITVDDETEQFVRTLVDFPKKLGKRPLAATVSNVKEQYLLRDNPDTAQNEDIAGQAALLKAKQGGSTVSTGGGGTGATSGNTGKSPTSGAV